MEKKKLIQKESRIEEEHGIAVQAAQDTSTKQHFSAVAFTLLHLLIKGDIKDLLTIVIHSPYLYSPRAEISGIAIFRDVRNGLQRVYGCYAHGFSIDSLYRNVRINIQ